MSTIRKQDQKKKKQWLKNQDHPVETEMRPPKVRKPQPKDRKYKHNKQYWLEEEEE